MKTALALCLVALLAAPLAAGPQQTSAPPAATSAVATNTAAVGGNEYRLGSGDKLRVEVYHEPQLSQSLQVRPDGKITMPLIGDVVAVGLTPVQLRDQITTSLKDYVNNPVVTVMVVEAVASTFYVMGEVNRPGTIPLLGPTTVLQALAMAGGLGQWAKPGKIRILRNGDRGAETIKFNYNDAIKGDGPPVYVQRGDTIIVP